MFDHNTMTVLIDLRIALAAHKLQNPVLCLTSNASENCLSDLLN